MTVSSIWLDVRIKLIDGGKMPEYKTAGAAAADCYARIPTGEITLLAGKRTLVPLGFAVELPEGFEAQIRPRSGLSKKGIDIAFGTGDADYRGELMACVINNSGEDYKIYNGDRICQMGIHEARQVRLITVDELSETERGKNGFGSTGLN